MPTLDCQRCPHSSAQAKCCSFYPFIANFKVGGILAGEAESVVQVLLERRQFVLPLGLLAPPGYQALYQQEPEREARLICPFYRSDDGRCRIWSERPAECANFFCFTNYGEAGEAYWQAQRDLANLKEDVVAAHVMLELGFHWREITQQREMIHVREFSREPLWRQSEAEHLKAWQHWAGRECEFFARARELAATLSEDQVMAELGAEGEAALIKVRLAQQRVLGTESLTMLGARPRPTPDEP